MRASHISAAAFAVVQYQRHLYNRDMDALHSAPTECSAGTVLRLAPTGSVIRSSSQSLYHLSRAFGPTKGLRILRLPDVKPPCSPWPQSYRTGVFFYFSTADATVTEALPILAGRAQRTYLHISYIPLPFGAFQTYPIGWKKHKSINFPHQDMRRGWKVQSSPSIMRRIIRPHDSPGNRSGVRPLQRHRPCC